MKKFCIIVLALLTYLPFDAQEINRLSYEDFMDIVLRHHPLAMQARLEPQEAEATLRLARGGFDPLVSASLQQKYFDDTEYYRLIDAGLKVPTWYGLELSGGYEQNQGQYLNPEANTPENGLVHAGIGVALGQGLLIDKRRAQLRKAELYLDLNQVEQTLMLNDLLLEAGMSYWIWFERTLDLRVFEEALDAAQVRFDAVKESARLGAVPSIDTLEAGIQVQARLLSVQQARLDLLNARAQVSGFLWASGLVPLELDVNTLPQELGETLVDAPPADLRLRLGELLAQHPMLRGYGYKLEALEIDRRWMAEQLKPRLDLKYNVLTERVGNTETETFNTENYTWGFDFEFPLFIREARGRLRLAELDIQGTDLDRADRQQMLQVKARQSINSWETTLEQFRLYSRTVQDYAGLLAGERQLFESGESSLFLVNRRELGYISAQIKRNEILTKNRMASLKTEYQLGILSTNFIESP
ncbi:MAG: TolC family protein [Flavobacteriales bacterium]|nr:TolC family protein [Flavobacteriales bacterium]